ncbi:DUF1993 domain-containing protein [Rhizobium sp. KVB221]|uniref:DUF1993 domain-containing protein n=1 Tax=Rhizobium setariae TaxID=2801340 RepID=A0A937CN81_9HYPH|nr:DUF1993 domain-containing protein [Rhizobium setariae]MBL0371739.1 DUF1993 domain-containing protein [Rhizobium setariae]
MSISLHSVATLSILPRFKGLKAALNQAEAFCTEKKIDPSVLLNARLAPDMRSLISQVQLSSDHAKGAFYRTAGLPLPSLADTEQSFADLHARIDKTVDLIGDVSAAQMEGRENADIVLKFPRGEMNFTGEGYLIGFALPNFYFHVTTAYAILRHNGMPLGKSMFMGRE